MDSYSKTNEMKIFIRFYTMWHVKTLCLVFGKISILNAVSLWLCSTNLWWSLTTTSIFHCPLSTYVLTEDYTILEALHYLFSEIWLRRIPCLNSNLFSRPLHIWRSFWFLDLHVLDAQNNSSSLFHQHIFRRFNSKL